jgi:hypothetical protein
MADTLAGINTLATSTPFVERVQAAIVRVAVDIIKATNESVGAVTPVDKARRSLAERVIEDRPVYAGHFAWMLASRTPITDAITDTDLIQAVQQAWNQLAKIAL